MRETPCNTHSGVHNGAQGAPQVMLVPLLPQASPRTAAPPSRYFYPVPLNHVSVQNGRLGATAAVGLPNRAGVTTQPIRNQHGSRPLPASGLLSNRAPAARGRQQGAMPATATASRPTTQSKGVTTTSAATVVESNSITFYLNGQKQTVTNPDPGSYLLDYIRLKPLTGTKR